MILGAQDKKRRRELKHFALLSIELCILQYDIYSHQSYTLCLLLSKRELYQFYGVLSYIRLVPFIVLSSILGSVLHPFLGGVREQYLSLNLNSNFWLQLILGGFVQAFRFSVLKTNTQTLIHRAAKKGGKLVKHVYEPGGPKENSFAPKKIHKT
jgi:hypothetical protein